MLTVRQPQLEALEAAVDRAVGERVARHLRVRCPRQTEGLDDVRLRERVEVGLGRARFYGLTAEIDLATFVGLMLVIGSTFDEHRWIRRVLRDTRKTAGVRLEEVIRCTPRRIWDEASRAARGKPWRATPARVGMVG